jgi:hypothetical protein
VRHRPGRDSGAATGLPFPQDLVQRRLISGGCWTPPTGVTYISLIRRTADGSVYELVPAVSVIVAEVWLHSVSTHTCAYAPLIQSLTFARSPVASRRSLLMTAFWMSLNALG